jgi:hypothetical protein
MSKPFWKNEENETFVLRSFGEGYFTLRFFLPPSYQDNLKKLSGLGSNINNPNYPSNHHPYNVIVTKQFNLDLIWYKLQISPLKDLTGLISTSKASSYGDLKVSPLIVKTTRTQWLFDSFEIEESPSPQLLLLISEDAEIDEIAAELGEQAADMVVKIRDYPQVKKLMQELIQED